MQQITRNRIVVLPPAMRDMQIVASVSGGKDSTALILALREAEIEARHVFADTGWESPETYAYLDKLRTTLGITIDVVRSPRGGMEDIARQKAGFPMRMGRWCTEKLKIEPLRAYFDALEETGAETVSVVGIRAAESEARARMPIMENSEAWGGYVWRPLIDWTVEDVLAIHHRHGVPVNPLYRRGHDRVGCYPCIMSNKEEIRLIAEHDPARIEQIASLETEFTELRATRNAETPGRYKHPIATFFSTRNGVGPMTVDRVAEWSRTARGGKALPLLPPAPTGGCMKWGLCEAPPPETVE